MTVSDSILGLANAPIRITEIEEDENGFLQVTAEEFPLGAATATLYATQAVANTPLNRNLVPDPVNPPIIFEPPAALVGATAQVWIAASGGSGGAADPNWGGAFVWLSLDGSSYFQIGTIVSPARQGALTAALPVFAGTNPDGADSLAVNMAESGGVLSSATALDAQLTSTLSIVDGELVSYETATLTAANHYSLTTLYRGLYGTAAAVHSAGAPFARLDGAVFEYDLPPQYVGQVLYIKLQSFNVFGAGVQEPVGLYRLHLYAERLGDRSSGGARAPRLDIDGFRPGHGKRRHGRRLRHATQSVRRARRRSRRSVRHSRNVLGKGRYWIRYTRTPPP